MDLTLLHTRMRRAFRERAGAVACLADGAGPQPDDQKADPRKLPITDEEIQYCLEGMPSMRFIEWIRARVLLLPVWI